MLQFSPFKYPFFLDFFDAKLGKSLLWNVGVYLLIWRHFPEELNLQNIMLDFFGGSQLIFRSQLISLYSASYKINLCRVFVKYAKLQTNLTVWSTVYIWNSSGISLKTYHLYPLLNYISYCGHVCVFLYQAILSTQFQTSQTIEFIVRSLQFPEAPDMILRN